jgi:putative hydrolase of the HAD superfamily
MMSVLQNIEAITFDFTGTLADFLFHSDSSGYRLFPDVLSTLQGLKSRGYRLAIISNAGSNLHSLVRYLELDVYFDVIVASQEFGSNKPDPAVFLHALQKLNVQPEHALHVGDSMVDDIEGAENAGMHCLFLNRSLAHSVGNTIHSLGVVLERLSDVQA